MFLFDYVIRMVMGIDKQQTEWGLYDKRVS